MPRRSLLLRQTALLVHLTSPATIFDGTAPGDPMLHSLDSGKLRLLARFSHEKRMEKIRAILPRTFDVLGDAQDGVQREFAEICPPASPGFIENAEQFCAFLRNGRRYRLRTPAHVADIAACEIAIAKLRSGAVPARTEGEEAGLRPAIRRGAKVILLRCTHDIRGVFEDDSLDRIVRRVCRLAIALPHDADMPQVFELPSAIFRMLAALDRWTDPEAVGLAIPPDALAIDLAGRGLLEIRS